MRKPVTKILSEDQFARVFPLVELHHRGLSLEQWLDYAAQHCHGGKASERGKPAHHSGRTIVVAALGDRIEVRADDHRLGRRILAGQGHIRVAGGIGVDHESKLHCRFGHQLVGALLAVAVRGTRDADPVMARLR